MLIVASLLPNLQTCGEPPKPDEMVLHMRLHKHAAMVGWLLGLSWYVPELAQKLALQHSSGLQAQKIAYQCPRVIQVFLI